MAIGRKRWTVDEETITYQLSSSYQKAKRFVS